MSELDRKIHEIQEKIHEEQRDIERLEREEEHLLEEGHRQHHHATVCITIDNKGYEVKPGEHSVTQLKELAQIPLAKELEQIINGTLTPLSDAGSVHIKRGEIFLSHARRGGSSHA